jgi:hypothetical protein
MEMIVFFQSRFLHGRQDGMQNINELYSSSCFEVKLLKRATTMRYCANIRLIRRQSSNTTLRVMLLLRICLRKNRVLEYLTCQLIRMTVFSYVHSVELKKKTTCRSFLT